MTRKSWCKHPPATRAPREDSGVSTVLGAVLMFGLFVITLVTVQVQFVPVWQHEREAGLMHDVMTQVGALKSGMDRQVGNQTNVPVTQAIPLKAPGGLGFFREKDLAGQLSFAPAAAGAGLSLSANQLMIQSQNGVNLYGLSEQWTTISGGTIGSVTAVRHLRIRVIDPACVASTTCQDPSTVSLAMTDANGNCAGRIDIVDSVAGSDRTIQARIFGPRSTPAATCAPQPITIHDTDAKKQTNPPYYYLDAFDPELQFRAVLAAAVYPLSLTFTTVGIQGDYTMVYDSLSGGSGVGGSGQLVQPYARTNPSGHIEVRKLNNRYPGQTYTLEYGAVILEQADGCGMVMPPQFSISSSTTQTSLAWSVPTLAGAGNSIQGAGTATVTSTPGERSFLLASAPRLNFTLTTEHAYQWAQFWDQTLSAAGLTGNVALAGTACEPGTSTCSTAALQYTICMSPTRATLNLYGPTTAPASTLHDIFLSFQQEPLAIELKATG